jgi:hypothetical protein
MAPFEHARSAEALWVGVVDVGVVADAVAHRSVKEPGLFGRLGHGPDRRGGLGADGRMVAVDEFSRAEVQPEAGIGVIRKLGFGYGA